jgi:hypothetical protein
MGRTVLSVDNCRHVSGLSVAIPHGVQQRAVTHRFYGFTAWRIERSIAAMFSQRVSFDDIREAIRLQLDRTNRITVMLYHGVKPATYVVLSDLRVTDDACMVEMLYHGDHVAVDARYTTLVKNGSVWHIIVPENVDMRISYYHRTDVVTPPKAFGKLTVLKPRIYRRKKSS